MSPDTQRMSAAVLYGKEQLRIERVDVPTLGRGDVLVRVRAALTCGTDVKVFRRGYHAKMIRPPDHREREGSRSKLLGTAMRAANDPAGRPNYRDLGLMLQFQWHNSYRLISFILNGAHQIATIQLSHPLIF